MPDQIGSPVDSTTGDNIFAIIESLAPVFNHQEKLHDNFIEIKPVKLNLGTYLKPL